MNEINRVLRHHYPDIDDIVSKQVKDPRRIKSSRYSIPELVLACVYMYMMRSGSRNSINEDGMFSQFKENYKSLFGFKLPHMDTVNDLFEKSDNTLLEGLKVKLIKRLLHQRVLHKFKYKHRYFIVAIDGTGIFRFDKCPYEGCPYKTSNKGKVTYYQTVVEAKVVCSNGFSLSIATEFVTNQDGADKQDCEYNATIRIIEKLRKYFPRLPMLIVLDGLYAKDPIMQAITSNGWQFGIVWKDKTLYNLQDNVGEQEDRIEQNSFDKMESITKNHYIESTYSYSNQPMKYKDNTLYYASVTEKSIQLESEKSETETTYKYLISIPPDRENIMAITEANRLRWKIENEGFNVQKNNGFDLHHKMNRNNLNAIKNYYHCLQIANLFNQLIILCRNTTVAAYGTTIKMWEYFCSELRIIENFQPMIINPKTNLRY